MAPSSAPIPTRMPNARPALAPPDMPLDAASAEEVADAVEDVKVAATELVTDDTAATKGEDEVSIFNVDCAWEVVGCEVALELWLSLSFVGVGVAFVSSSSSSLELVGRGRTAGGTSVLTCCEVGSSS